MGGSVEERNDLPSLSRGAADKLAVAAACTAGAGVLHASVIAEHLEEYWLFGAFFIVSAALQLGWAAALLWRPSRTHLALGLLGNGTIVVIWILSRTAGLPVGPESWTPEELAAADVVATVLEVAAIYVIYVLIRIATPTGSVSTRATSRVSRVIAVVVAIAVGWIVIQDESGAASDACRHSDVESSPAGPLFPVDGHSMLSRHTPPTATRPYQRLGLVAGILLNCGDSPARITDVEIGATGRGATVEGVFVLPRSLAPPGQPVAAATMQRHGRLVNGYPVVPTDDKPREVLAVAVKTQPSSETLPFLVSVVVVEYEVDGERYRAPFGSIARIEFRRRD